MAGLSGIVKKISDLVSGTPANDDCFIFGKSDLKKITLEDLKKSLGINAINSALTEDEKFLSPKASQNTFSNLLHIDTSGSYNIDQMKTGCVATEDASELSGSPITEGAFYAWRELFWIPNASQNSGGKCIVRLTEAYPIAGRIWITAYNTDISEWSQWTEIMPSS